MANPFLGQIMPVGWNFAARGWALCDGQLLPISQNSALFSLLGTAFGGDGRTTFALPDLRGRSIKHVGTGAGLSPVNWGQRGGREYVTLGVGNLPSHNHQVLVQSGEGDSNEPAGRFLAASSEGDGVYKATANGNHLNAGAITNTGGGQSFNVLNPFLGIYVLIALQGVFPSRS
ncbi:MAG: phage tail protein [Planctomycetota bacterium]|jgi:microcystin-dependent protein